MGDDTLASAPIGDVIEVLATRRDTPAAALACCVLRIEEAAPPLLLLLERAAIHGLRRERDRELLFRGVHVLAAARVAAACQPLLRYLRQPLEEVDATLGDAVVETLPRVAAGVFDGDAPALFAAIADRRIDEAARWSLLTAAAFLTWDGRIDAGATHAFLRRFGDEGLAPPRDAAWIGWGEAVAMLGLADLAPAVEAVWATLPDGFADLPHFRETLADAQTEPRDPGRFEARNAGYLDDIETALDWGSSGGGGDAPVQVPVTNPLRGVGRNDPCPCGSGRKFKKCCGAAA